MSTFGRLKNCSRAFIATLVSAAFFWTLVLSGSPQLHGRLHADANGIGHTCAVTLIASGSYDHAAHPPLLSVPAPSIHFSTIPTLTPQWVESLFLGARIFEHAPPVA
jgi:hypothetical protein